MWAWRWGTKLRSGDPGSTSWELHPSASHFLFLQPQSSLKQEAWLSSPRGGATIGGHDAATCYSSSSQEFLLNIHWVPELEWLKNQTVCYTAGGGCLQWGTCAGSAGLPGAQHPSGSVKEELIFPSCCQLLTSPDALTQSLPGFQHCPLGNSSRPPAFFGERVPPLPPG